MYTGPHIIKDGLVFGYDTGYGIADNATATRFYPGENTVNLVTNGDFSNGSTGWTFNGSAASYSEVTTFQGRSVFKANGLTTYNDRGYLSQSINVTSGQTYTVSFNYYLISGQLTYDPDSANNSNSTFTSPTGEWKTHTHTFTAASSTLFINLWGVNANPGYWYITDIQCEQKAHRTPFVNGTRSNTASLIDLKETTDINVSNVSFDSTGQPHFDGTDDEIQLPTNDWNKVTAVTVEAVVKINGAPIDGNGYHVVVQKDGAYSGGAVYGIRISGSGQPLGTFSTGNTSSTTHVDTVYGSVMTSNKYYHLVYTRKVSESVFYQNGTPIVTDTSNNGVIYNNTNTVTIGEGDGRQLYGNIPVVKIYNKVLTASEIKQNYNAYKNRFDI